MKMPSSKQELKEITITKKESQMFIYCLKIEVPGHIQPSTYINVTTMQCIQVSTNNVYTGKNDTDT